MYSCHSALRSSERKWWQPAAVMVASLACLVAAVMVATPVCLVAAVMVAMPAAAS
jgi:hypothetical protein